MPLNREQLREVEVQMRASLAETLNVGRKHPLSDEALRKIFWAAWGGRLADTEQEHEAELDRLLADE